MNGGSASLGSVKIPYYVVIGARGYWRPNAPMKKLGFSDIRCGADGPSAWRIAREWADRWELVRTGKADALNADATKRPREEIEAYRKYPPNSVGAAFQAYIRTDEWTKRKALSTRNKIWWPAWFRIRDMWGDCDPNTITFEQMSQWRGDLEAAFGRSVSHKTLKVWRALWRVMSAMKIVHCSDPSSTIRNVAPQPRGARWSEGEAVVLVKTAWRVGYHGLACIIAVSWDTLFSPVDVRTLAARHKRIMGDRLHFDRSVEGRAKTGRPALGTVCRRTKALVEAYETKLGTVLLPDAILFRNRSGAPYRDDTLCDDFADVREIAFPGDRRRLMDMRRSGTVEAVAGGAEAIGLASKLANSIDRSNAIHKTYSPVDIATVLDVDEARKRGRTKIRRRES